MFGGEPETRGAKDSGTHTSASTKPPETIVTVITVEHFEYEKLEASRCQDVTRAKTE